MATSDDWKMAIREMTSIDSLIPFLSPLAVLIGVIVSARMIRSQMRVNIMINARNKSVGYSLYANQHLRDARISVERAFGVMSLQREAISMTRINETKETDPEVYAAILTLLAHWENMALSIKLGIADEEACYEMVASTMIQHVRIFRPFIDERRDGNPRAYYYLIEMQRRWQDNLRETNPALLSSGQVKFMPLGVLKRK